MKKISTNTICSIIAMSSVIVMLIWGYMADDFAHSWLAIMIGGVVAIAIRMVRKDIEEAERKEKEENKTAE